MAHTCALILASPGDGHNKLKGVEKDISTMKRLFENEGVTIHDAIYQINFKQRHALRAIEELFSRRDFKTYLIYYSGHGEDDDGSKTGNWVFIDGTLSCGNVLDCWKRSGKQNESRLVIISDSCYAGKWNRYIKTADTRDCYYIHVLAATGEDESSGDSDDGGNFTKDFANPHPENQLTTKCCALTKKRGIVTQEKCYGNTWSYLTGHLLQWQSKKWYIYKNRHTLHFLLVYFEFSRE